MMSIALFLPKVPGYSETFFHHKIKFLREAGYALTLVASNPNRVSISGVAIVSPLWFSSNGGVWMVGNLIRAFLGILLSPVKSMRFWKWERAYGLSKFDVLKRLIVNANLFDLKVDWVHFGFSTMALGHESLAKTLGARMAVSIRGFDISIYPLKHPGCYHILWQNVDKVHTISDDLLAYARRFGLPEQVAVTKITPAIESGLFENKERKGTLGDPLKILTIGRLHWKKGLEYTVKSLSVLAQWGIEFHYTVVGAGEELERLKFAVHQLGIAHKVSFTGVLPHREIPSIMANHDVYLQYSLQEGFCNAVLEAQCNGLICVVSDAEGLSENVLHGKTGFVVGGRNPLALAQQLSEIVKMSPQNRLGMIHMAQSRVQKEFDLRIQKEKFVTFYQK